MLALLALFLFSLGRPSKTKMNNSFSESEALQPVGELLRSPHVAVVTLGFAGLATVLAQSTSGQVDHRIRESGLLPVIIRGMRRVSDVLYRDPSISDWFEREVENQQGLVLLLENGILGVLASQLRNVGVDDDDDDEHGLTKVALRFLSILKSDAMTDHARELIVADILEHKYMDLLLQGTERSEDNLLGSFLALVALATFIHESWVPDEALSAWCTLDVAGRVLRVMERPFAQMPDYDELRLYSTVATVVGRCARHLDDHAQPMSDHTAETAVSGLLRAIQSSPNETFRGAFTIMAYKVVKYLCDADGRALPAGFVTSDRIQQLFHGASAVESVDPTLVSMTLSVGLSLLCVCPDGELTEALCDDLFARLDAVLTDMEDIDAFWGSVSGAIARGQDRLPGNFLEHAVTQCEFRPSVCAYRVAMVVCVHRRLLPELGRRLALVALRLFDSSEGFDDDDRSFLISSVYAFHSMRCFLDATALEPHRDMVSRLIAKRDNRDLAFVVVSAVKTHVDWLVEHAPRVVQWALEDPSAEFVWPAIYTGLASYYDDCRPVFARHWGMSAWKREVLCAKTPEEQAQHVSFMVNLLKRRGEASLASLFGESSTAEEESSEDDSSRLVDILVDLLVHAGAESAPVRALRAICSVLLAMMMRCSHPETEFGEEHLRMLDAFETGKDYDAVVFWTLLYNWCTSKYAPKLVTSGRWQNVASSKWSPRHCDIGIVRSTLMLLHPDSSLTPDLRTRVVNELVRPRARYIREMVEWIGNPSSVSSEEATPVLQLLTIMGEHDASAMECVAETPRLAEALHERMATSEPTLLLFLVLTCLSLTRFESGVKLLTETALLEDVAGCVAKDPLCSKEALGCVVNCYAQASAPSERRLGSLQSYLEQTVQSCPFDQTRQMAQQVLMRLDIS